MRMARGEVLFRQSSGLASSGLACSSSGAQSSSDGKNDAGQKEVELLYLAHEGNFSEIQSLLSQGVVPVNFADYDGRTALHVAACEGHLDVVRLLVSKGADVNARDRWGSTPLDDAEHYDKKDVCKQLMEHGAKLYHSPRLRVKEPLPISETEINPAELKYLDKTVTKRGYKVAIWRGIEVFVKCFKGLDYGEKEIMAFRGELSVLQKLRHPNIVQFLGAVTQSTPVMIIFEYCPQGDLYQFLKEKGALKSSKAIDCSLDIARGLNFMHEHKPEAIVHRDLKPKNVLRDNCGHLKVADLGLSKVLKFAAQTISEDGPPQLKGSSCRYMAPEVFKRCNYGKEVDVFAFGLIVQEMIEGVPPMSGLENEKVPSAYADDNKRPPFRASMRCYPGDLKELIEECWAADPGKRPTFTQIIRRLEIIQTKQRKAKWSVSSLWGHH